MIDLVRNDEPQIVSSPLVILDGWSERPIRGGERYWHELLDKLSQRCSIERVIRTEMGVVDHDPDVMRTALRTRGVLDRHGSILQDGSLYYALWKANREIRANAKAQIVCFLQEFPPYREGRLRVRLHLERVFLRYASTVHHFVVVSEGLRQTLRARGVPSARISICEPGVAASLRLAASACGPKRADGQLRLLTAGVYHPSKGQGLLVDALCDTRRNEWSHRVEADLFGDDTSGFGAQLQTRITRAGATDRIRIHGHVDAVRMQQAFRDSNIFVFLAEGEGLPVALMESMLHGCIPIVPKRSPMAHVVSDRKTGFVISRTSRALASCLEQLSRSPETRRVLSAEAKAFAETRFVSWSEAGERAAQEIASRL